MEHIAADKVNGIQRGKAETNGNGDARPPFGQAEKLSEHDLDLAAVGEDQVIDILAADDRQHDQDDQLNKLHYDLDDALCFAVDHVDHDIHAQMCVLAVRIGAADKHGPHEQAGNDLLAPL